LTPNRRGQRISFIVDTNKDRKHFQVGILFRRTYSGPGRNREWRSSWRDRTGRVKGARSR